MPVFHYLKFYFKSPCATAPVFLRRNLKFYYNSAGFRVLSPLERGAERSDGGVCKNGENTPPPDGVGVLLSRGDKSKKVGEF